MIQFSLIGAVKMIPLLTPYFIAATCIIAPLLGALGAWYALRTRETVVDRAAHIGAVLLVAAIMFGGVKDLGPYGRASSRKRQPDPAWLALTNEQRWSWRLTVGGAASVLAAAGAGGVLLVVRRPDDLERKHLRES
ncbi:MAG: hypothetical protein JSR77_08520 [Planctomycetes bacterium]|nr:hypothetical protein [Planctomycetota bacterium]